MIVVVIVMIVVIVMMIVITMKIIMIIGRLPEPEPEHDLVQAPAPDLQGPGNK